MNDTDDIDDVADFSILLNKSRKRGEGSAPKRGSKNFAPDDSSSQQTALEQSREALWDLIGEVKPLAGQHSVGILCSNIGSENGSGLWTTTLTQQKGTYYQYMGHTIQGKTTLYLEEAAWLINRHALSVYTQDASEPMDKTRATFEDYCSLMFGSMDGWITFEKYQVYAYLKRLGYIVQRSADLPPRLCTKDLAAPHGYRSWWDQFIQLTGQLCHHTILIIRAIARSIVALSPHPLVKHYQCKTHNDVYSSLRTISFDPWHHPSVNFDTRHYPYTIAWDVYKPNPKWKKRDPGTPDYRIVVGNMNDPLPSPGNVNYLFSLLYGLPHKDNAYYPIRNTRSMQSQPAILMGLVGNAEGVTFIRLQSDGISDISHSFG